MDKNIILGLLLEYDRADEEDQSTINKAQERIDARKSARSAVLGTLTKEERRSLAAPTAKTEPRSRGNDQPKQSRILASDIWAVINEKKGTSFTTAEIKNIVIERHPGKTMRRTAVPNAIYVLKKQGKLKEVCPKDSQKDAQYAFIE